MCSGMVPQNAIATTPSAELDIRGRATFRGATPLLMEIINSTVEISGQPLSNDNLYDIMTDDGITLITIAVIVELYVSLEN